MKKDNKSSFAKNSKIAFAATILGGSVLTAQMPLFSQESVKSTGKQSVQSSVAEKTASKSAATDIHIKISSMDKVSIVGMDNGNTIYQNSRGEYFYLDSKTGDMKSVKKDFFMKFVSKSSAPATGQTLNHIKFDGIKGESKVTIIGLDRSGNVIQQNSKGEKFYLNPKTGDMVFVK